MRFRGYAALSLAAVLFPVSDLIQRFVVCPIARMFPARRPAILAGWLRFLSRTLFMILRRVGGASIPRPGRVPGGPGVLILMNHQSVLDIPMVVVSIDGVFPRIVTRLRYARWIPLISHTVRMFEYPTVNPAAKAGKGRRLLEQLDHVARTSEAPLVLFPEGTRTQDGEIGRFQTAGLERILRARDWKVYVFVSDGYWRHRRLVDFLGGMQDIEGHLSVLGPFEWKDPGADPGDFIARMRGQMVDQLARVRRVEADLARAPDAAPTLTRDPDPAPTSP